MKRVLVLSLLLAFFHGIANAQFSETVEVRVTNVEAIVTDKAGKPVGGLTKDDFEVYENGVKQELTNFAEVRENVPAATLTPGEAAPAAEPVARDPRRRLITVFVDNASLEMANRNVVLPELQRFLRESVRPGDGVSIYTWGNSLQVELEPTSDPELIEAAVKRIPKRALTAGGNSRSQFEYEITQYIESYKGRVPPELPPIGTAITIASGYANRSTVEMRQKAEALKSVIASVRGVDARKVLVLLTQSLETNPGEYPFMFLDALRDEFEGRFSPMSEARIYDLPEVANELAGAANAAGITLYPINLAGKFTDESMRDASHNLQLTLRPVITAGTSTINMHSIAVNTGGLATSGSSNWKLAFDTIANDLNIYYSLGYRTSGERKDRTKNVDVRLKKRGYTVRTRKAIVERTASSEMTDSVTANLFHDPSQNDLGVEAVVEEDNTPAEGNNVVIPVRITIPTETLTLIPDGDDLAGSFSLFAAFLRQDGAVSRVNRQTHQIRFPAESLSRRKELTINLSVTADPRTGSISVGVMDEASRATGFAVVKVN
ncbi:MAG TPA: VWA domain-containing protein [Thermoanaerobaculia bacterium]|nr:VWA domain-containing protein [Thermoanaerobaculia bacterium]